eukprot:6211438-Pleurochrysis_carterae.AAC.1
MRTNLDVLKRGWRKNCLRGKKASKARRHSVCECARRGAAILTTQKDATVRCGPAVLLRVA